MSDASDTSRRKFLLTAVLAAAASSTKRVQAAAPASIGATPTPKLLSKLESAVLFAGNAKTAYRDPAALYHAGWFYLYFTLVTTEADGKAYSSVAWSRSRNLQRWSVPKRLTPLDKKLDYGSPGDIVRFADRWVLCLQTYPRPNGERYGNKDSRVWTMTSRDLKIWTSPEILRVKGSALADADMGRMIDPFLFRDKDVASKWWCFYKQNGISRSWSNDLRTWTYAGTTLAGENPCVIVDRNEYVLFHSPPNGIGVKRSTDLVHWIDGELLTLGQSDWPWAQGRLTAGFVLDLRADRRVGKALMFFHGSTFMEDNPRGGFDNFASLGIAWSDDLMQWNWPR